MSFLLILTSSLPAQESADTMYRAMFFGRMNSARSEAMGRAVLLPGEEVFSHTENPASPGLGTGLRAGGSYAGPFFNFPDGEYDYFGLAVNTGSRGAFGFSRKHFESRRINHDFSASLSTISISIPLLAGINGGISLNQIEQEVYSLNNNGVDDSAPIGLTGKRDGFFINAGFMKDFSFSYGERLSGSLTFGASMMNIGSSEMSGSGFTDIAFESEIPRMYRAGGSVILTRVSDPNAWYGKVSFRGVVEILNETGGTEYSEFNTGIELEALTLLFCRAGYYSISPGIYYIEELTEFTYGFGLRLPLYRFTGGTLPFDMRLDYTALDEPYDNLLAKQSSFDIFQVSIDFSYGR